jgi:nitric-oxide synthase
LNGSPNLAEVLDDFPSVRPNASLLVTQLPKLQPRFYSISSSPKVSDDIHLTMGVVEFKRANRGMFYGVCTKWIDDLNLNDIVPSFIRG